MNDNLLHSFSYNDVHIAPKNQIDLHQQSTWLSSARAVRCRLKCHNERNPHLQLLAGKAEDSGETAGASCEEGGDDVKSARPLRPGRHTCYNGGVQQDASGRPVADPENPSQFGLESATRLHG